MSVKYEQCDGSKINFITEGPILKALFFIALPIVLSNLLQSVIILVDTYFIGHLGDNALAACSASMSVVMALLTIAIGINIAGAAFISRAYGAKKHDRIPVILGHLFYIGTAFSIVIALIGIFGTETLLRAMGADPAVVSDGVKFLQPILICIFLLIFLMLLCTILINTGDTKTPMIVMLAVNIVNIVLNPTLIQGLWIFPKLGIAGSAYASIISQAVGVVLILLVMYFAPSHRNSPVKFPKKWTFEPHLIKDIVVVAIPSVIQTAIRSFSFLVLTWVIILYGTSALAAYGVCIRLDPLAFFLVTGICTAVEVMVGQNLGAGKPKRAESAAKYGILANTIIMIVIGVIFFIFAKYLIGFFVSTSESLEIGISFMQIIPLSYFISAIAMTLGVAMSGAGMTRPGMYAAFLGQFITEVGLAALFKVVFDLPIHYIWIASIIGAVVTLLVDLYFFRKGDWKKKELHLDAHS